MVPGISRRLDQFFYDMGGGSLVWVAHAKINDVLARLARLQFEGLDLIEDIRRQPIDSKEAFFAFHDYNELTKMRGPQERSVEEVILSKRDDIVNILKPFGVFIAKTNR